MSNEAKAGLFSALAKGAQGLTHGLMTRDEVQLKRAQSKRELDKLRMTEESDTFEQQLKVVQMQNEQLLKQGAKRDLYDSFDLYRADGNTEHINRALHTNEALKQAFPDVVAIDRLHPDADRDLMHRENLPADIMTDPNMQKRFVRITKPDGTKTIADMVTVYGALGYTQHKSAQDLERMLKESQIARNLRTGTSKGSSATAMLKNSREYAAAQSRIDAGQGTAADEAFVRFAEKDLAGTTPGKMDLAEDATAKLLSLFGNEDKFFEADFTDPKNYRKAYPLVARIEKLEGAEFSAETKRELRNIAALNALGKPGTKIGADETGLIDSIFLKTKKYMSDEVGGIEATSAYSAFRNSVRHALYGSALTATEVASFNEAFGTLGQKLGPVLQQFKTAITQVKGKLESIARMSNPYTAKVRLGVDQEAVDDMILALDERLAKLEDYGKAQVKHSFEIDKDKKAKLDAKFKNTGVK